MPSMKLLQPKYCLVLLLSQVFIIPNFGITAKFTYTKVSSCAPTIIKFINNSTRGTGITYTWDFGLGAINSTSDTAAKEQVYSKAGTYTVRLKVTDGTYQDSTSTVITIFGGPAANFTADKVYGCPPLLVKFTSTSVAGESEIKSTSWDFRNGDYKEGSPVQYTYNSTGTYDVILRVTDKNGCYSVLESDKLISVTDKPKVNFAASDTFACSPPLNVTYTNLSTGSSVMSYKWDFGNGSTSTDISNSSVYSAEGSYNVKLTAKDQYGCSDSLIRKSYITIGYPKGTLVIYNGRNQAVDQSYLCDGKYKFVFSNSNLPDYTWVITENSKTTTIHGKSTLTYTINGSGTIDIKLIYGKNLSCTDSISESFVKSYIKASFSMNDNVFCSLPSQVTLTNSSQNADKISWYLSDKLISTDKVASYTITKNDMPAETYQQLYNHDVNMITLPVKLVASNGGVCFDSITSNVTIALPVARFVPDKISGCVPLQVSLSDSSKSYFNINSFTYKIGAESVTSTNNSAVNYTFTKPGVYDVSEIIKSGTCADTSETIRIVAGDKLVPDFTVAPAEVCNGGDIRLTGSVAANSLVRMWRFTSNNLFNLNFASRPDTTFAVYSDTAGYKGISLQVDYNGCLSSTTKKNILLIKGPVGTFNDSFKCDSPLVYHFKSNISPATSLIWNIDTTVYNNVDSQRYVFPKRGDYMVKLTATDNASSCTLTRTKVIKVRQVKAVFALTDTTFCVGDSVHVAADSSKDYINTCYNEGFLWKFGDDSPPRRTFMTSYDHIYTSKGNDTISLIVTADNGCTDTVKKVVHVFRPSGNFTADPVTGCVPSLNVNFKNTSTDTTIVSWIWNFGDNSSDSTNSITLAHTFSSDVKKTYYPALTVYDAYKCSSNYSIPINLTATNSEFQANKTGICIGGTVVFTAVDTTLTNLLWNYGDGTANGTSNTHTYATSGKFTVSLTGTKAGCSATVTKSNYINVEQANANFTFGDSIYYCYPDTLHFVHDNSIGSPAVDYLWKFGSIVIADRTSNNVKYVFTRTGNYTTSLTVKTLNGCIASSSKHVKITGPNAYITYSPKKLCYKDAVTFKLDSLKDVVNWKWIFGDGSTSTINPVSHPYASRGKIVPSVQLTNSTCSAIIVLDTLSISKAQASFISSDSTVKVCLGDKLNLLNKSIFSTSWDWYIDNVKSCTTYNYSNILLSKTGGYNIKLVAKDASGCTDTLAKTFTVYPKPVFTITGDSILCSGMTAITLTVSNSAGTKIKWSPSTGLSTTTAFTTKAKPTVSTTYTALVTNTYGCSASQTKVIMVNQPFDLSRNPVGDTTIYIGQKVQLIVSTSESNVKYSWSPDYNISCLHCNNPWVNPAKSTTYNVETENGCFDFLEKFNVEVIVDFYLEAPSAFTPNGDSNNDLLKFEGKNITSFNLKIFNRWGEIVFSTNDIKEGWDGYVNGHPQNTDTYKYLVKAETVHGYIFEKKGEFLLLK
jgi:gliding motility-associated-like protein